MADSSSDGAPSSNLNPFTQNITFTGPDGDSFMVNMVDVDQQLLYTTRVAIQYGAQMGVCAVMAIVLAAMSSRQSMRKPLFILNFSSLLLGLFRGLFLALYTVSPWVQFYTRFTGDVSYVGTVHTSNSIAAAIFPLLMAITVDASLVLQAHAVCTQLDQKFIKYPLLCLSIVIILLAIGFRMAQCILNVGFILNAEVFSAQYLRHASLITNTLAVWWFMGIFMFKLGYTVWTRKKMGWAAMSIFHTLAIAAGCTMIVPSIFAVLQFAAPIAFPEGGTWTLTTTALLLPLSTLWAKMTMEEELTSLRASRNSQNSSNGHSISANTRFGSQSSTVAGYEKERTNSAIPLTANSVTIDTIIEHASPPTIMRDSTEVDLERMGVRVDRSYIVNEVDAQR